MLEDNLPFSFKVDVILFFFTKISQYLATKKTYRNLKLSIKLKYSLPSTTRAQKNVYLHDHFTPRVNFFSRLFMPLLSISLSKKANIFLLVVCIIIFNET